MANEAPSVATTLPMGLAALFDAAKEAAQELYAADDRVYALRGMPPLPKDVRDPLPQEINKHALLLADLTRSKSQSYWMGRLASESACFNERGEGVGYTFSPNLHMPGAWTLANAIGTFCDYGPGPDNEDGDYRHVPGIDSVYVGLPAEALKLAILAVLSDGLDLCAWIAAMAACGEGVVLNGEDREEPWATLVLEGARKARLSVHLDHTGAHGHIIATDREPVMFVVSRETRIHTTIRQALEAAHAR